MICLDTTFLIQLWRNRQKPDHPTVRFLSEHPAEIFIVPVAAAGEFLEGAAVISAVRLKDAMRFLTLFEIGASTLETARHYSRIAADLRQRDLLRGMSKADLWIAACALEQRAPLATQNRKHFEPIAGLQVISH